MAYGTGIGVKSKNIFIFAKLFFLCYDMKKRRMRDAYAVSLSNYIRRIYEKRIGGL